MKLSKIALLLLVITLLTSCASGYKTINPENLYYNSSDLEKGVSLSYKYDLLNKKYSKKEVKRGVKLVAIKITNNSDKDLVFGQDILLTQGNGGSLNIMDTNAIFSKLKQSTLSYLPYMFLSVLQLTKTETTNGVTTTESIFPIGLILGPGVTAGNMIVAGSANTKFKKDLLNYNLNGTLIKKGETKSGLIGIKSEGYDQIKINIK